MPWSDIFMRGARRLTDRKTYQVLGLSILAGQVVPLLFGLLALIGRNLGVMVMFAILLVVWEWIVSTFTWGALSVAALERPAHTGIRQVLNETTASIGSLLGVTIVLFGLGVSALAVIVLLSLLGLGGSALAPLLGLITPVLLVFGGLAGLALLAVGRLAVPAVVADSLRASDALHRAWTLVRTRSAEFVLFQAAETVLASGVWLGICGPVLLGASSAVGIESLFSEVGLLSDFLGDGVNGSASVVGVALFAMAIVAFLSMVGGVAGSFSAGSAVGFYLKLSGPNVVPLAGTAPDQARFCDRCGNSMTGGAGFCDRCGQMMSVG